MPIHKRRAPLPVASRGLLGRGSAKIQLAACLLLLRENSRQSAQKNSGVAVYMRSSPPGEEARREGTAGSGLSIRTYCILLIAAFGATRPAQFIDRGRYKGRWLKKEKRDRLGWRGGRSFGCCPPPFLLCTHTKYTTQLPGSCAHKEYPVRLPCGGDARCGMVVQCAVTGGLV